MTGHDQQSPPKSRISIPDKFEPELKAVTESFPSIIHLKPPTTSLHLAEL